MTDLHLPDIVVASEWGARRRWRAGDEIYDWPAAKGIGIYLIESGELSLQVKGMELTIRTGEVAIVPPGWHRDRFHARADTAWLSVGIDASLYGQVDVNRVVAGPARFLLKSSSYRVWSAIMGSIAAQWCESPSPKTPLVAPASLSSEARRMVADRLSGALFGLLWEECEEVRTSLLLTAPGWFLGLIRNIYRQPALSLAEQATEAGVSVAHLRRVFHRFLGTSPQEYLGRVRLELAQQRLVSTGDAIPVIAHSVGFASVAHFTVKFAAYYGMPPAAYRRREPLGDL
jgi:AraC-like DNA-binding protein